jgi:hypothetical protein
MSNSETYTCAVCRRTYPKERPEAEAIAECIALWGEFPKEEERAVLCDDCFNGRTPGTRSYKKVLAERGEREH